MNGAHAAMWRGRKTIWGALISFSVLISTSNFRANADGVDLRRNYSNELSSELLGKPDGWVSLGEGQGWRGVVLAPPGTSLAPIEEAYGGFADNLVQTLTDELVFDRPVHVRDGELIFSPLTLQSVWSDLLTRTMPTDALYKGRTLPTDVSRWLYAPILSKGKKRYVIGYSDHPSVYLNTYERYQSLYTLLNAGRSNDLWRLVPELKKYKSFAEADRDVRYLWLRYGFKAEIESAEARLALFQNGQHWRDWIAVKALYDNNQIPVNEALTLPTTILFPPPGSWSTIGSWLQLQSRVLTDGPIVHYQLERVSVVRPWFDIQALVDNRIAIDKPTNPDFIVSDGQISLPDNTGNGTLVGYVEELLLIRDVHAIGAGGNFQQSKHPLASFAYPDAINLVGYVIRLLPKSPN
jgi:hypothetical protein